MKKITLWLFALFTCWQISAQTGTVVIGVNDGTPNTSTGDPSPLQDYWKVQRTQYLYTAAELTGAGLVAGNITEIGWVVTSINASTLQENYTISMKSTASTVLTTTFESGATVVYGPTDFTPSGTGNVMFTLTTPFVWDGTSNVIIELCAGLSTGTYTENVSCANSTTAGINTVYFRNDTSGTPCTEATGTTVNQRPLLVATGSVASCLAPLNIVSANVTAYTADISWDAVVPTPGIGYEYVVSTSNVAPTGAGTTTTNIYASIVGLSPQTTYYVFVRSNCSAGVFSGWNGPSSFTTACAPITTYPSLEPFATFLPNQCWSQGDGGDLTAGPSTFGTSNFYTDGFANVGFTGAFSYNIWLAAANDWVISPQYTIPATGYELKFDAAAANYGVTTPVTNWESDDFVEVLVSATGTTNWNVLYTYNDTNVPSNVGAANIIDLDAYAGQTVRFAYRVVEGATDGAADLEFSVDNFQVRVSPTCPDQTGLTVGSITSTTADFSWSDLSAGGALGYEYAVTTSATPPASGTATAGTIYSATSLSPQTTYYLHVRSSCAAATFGNWATLSFITNCASVTSFIQNFDTVTTPAFPTCWTKVGAGGTTNTQTGSANSAPNTMYFASFSTASLAVVSMQQVSNLGAGTNRIKFDMRANFTVGGVVEFGYLTDPLDANTFVSLTSFTAAALTYSTYQYSPPAGSYSDYPAFRHTGSPGNSVLIDNVIWEANPACPDQTGAVVSAITATGASTSWDDLFVAGYEYAITTSATPPASGTATTAIFYMATGLSPQTLYYLHVRPMCSVGVYGNWASTSFTTACVPYTTLPWTENFDALATGTNLFPTCWNYSNTTNDWSIATFPVAYSGANSLRRTWSTDGWAFTPMFTLAAGTSYTFSYYVRTNDTTVGYDVTVGVGNTQNSAGMTTTLSTVVGYQGPTWTLVTLEYTPTVSGDYSFGVHVVAPVAPNGINFDNFELKVTPACPAPIASASAVTDVTANLSWAAVASATLGYEYVLDNVATDPTGAGTSTLALAYPASGLTPSTVYYFHIRSVCSVGTYSAWSTISFTTVATPPVNDNCSTAIAVTSIPYSNTQDASAASQSAFVTACADTMNDGVWYTVVGNGYDIIVDVNAVVGWDPQIDVYTGSCGVFTCVGSEDAGGTSGSESITIAASTLGTTYFINVGHYSGFTNSPEGPFTINISSPLNANSFDKSTFVAYPNPVKDVLNLSYKSAISNVRVVNLLGQEVLNTKTNTNDVKVNMSALNAGAYMVNITVEDTVHTIKVIKE